MRSSTPSSSPPTDPATGAAVAPVVVTPIVGGVVLLGDEPPVAVVFGVLILTAVTIIGQASRQQVRPVVVDRPTRAPLR
jgi:hypothetical protein